MKKYYDIPDERLVCMLDWSKGGSLEDAKKYLKNENIREISKSEFNKLGDEYANGNHQMKLGEKQ